MNFLPDSCSGNIWKDYDSSMGGGVLIAATKNLDIAEFKLSKKNVQSVWAKS